MSVVEPTKGPWTYREDGDANVYHVMDGTGSWLMALLHNGKDVTDKQRANMRLASAAPVLLERLEAAAADYCDETCIRPTHTYDCEANYAAIAAAKGA